jgi:hypothetical protein
MKHLFFNTAVVTYVYPDGSLRVITYSELKEGDTLEYTYVSNGIGRSNIARIIDNRQSQGLFNNYDRPNTYRLFMAQ